MKTALVNEDVHNNGTDWSVSMDGYNTDNDSQTIICANSAEAFKLKAIIDELKSTLSWLCETIEPMLDEKYEYDSQLMLKLDDIKEKHL